MTETKHDSAESPMKLPRLRRVAIAVTEALRGKLEDLPGVVRVETPEAQERRALALVEEWHETRNNL